VGRIIVRLAILVVLLPAPVALSAPSEYGVYLPAILKPPCGPVRVFDKDGDERDWDWLQQTFGPVWIQMGDGAACLTELRDEEGPISTTVQLLDADGQPKGGVTVVLYYSSAPVLPPELVGCYDRGVYGQTKSPPDPAAGTIGFDISGGFYAPPDIGGFTIWIGTTGSDCIHGIGWLVYTNHRHLNPTFQLR
jgi:hypothetical protein